MTTIDHGTNAVPMLQCPDRTISIYSTLTLALRDMRKANGRDLVTGTGKGNESWIGLSLGMVIIDTLTGPGTAGVGKKWTKLLTAHRVDKADADIIYSTRCALLHGYGIPNEDMLGRRRMAFTDAHDAPALDTDTAGWAYLSVPVFCRTLVERLASEACDDWDSTYVDTRMLL